MEIGRLYKAYNQIFVIRATKCFVQVSDLLVIIRNKKIDIFA